MMKLLLVLFTVLGATCGQNEERIEKLEQTVNNLGRQVMLQQLFVEERIRSDGRSGVKQIRHNNGGTRPYFYESHNLDYIAQLHDHGNHIKTVGLGEFVAVLNGVEFRTRHNDYMLKQPSTTSTTFHETEFIEYPDVPPSVLEKVTVEEQTEEMRQYFRAFKNQDTRIRDYKPYFKPVLCYLEGAWHTHSENIEESFDSDRHQLDATSWFDLQQKTIYTSKLGLKSTLENFAYLPTTLIDVINGTATYAQWNYRVLCHQIQKELWTNRLRPVDEVAARIARGETFEEYTNSRAARYTLNGRDMTFYVDAKYSYGLLSDIMEEIPGKDNYPGVVRDESFGQKAYRYRNQNEELNAARYHRVFISKVAGANGQNIRHRGFSDDNLYVAMTSNPEIAEVSVHDCKKGSQVEGCATYRSRVSYAIPLEIVFLTPMHNWNPYNIAYHGWNREETAKVVEANGRDGTLTPEKAWDGNHGKLFYRTPKELFIGAEVGKAPADTAVGLAGVLDQTGTMREVVASGVRCIVPEMEGVGIVRTRYPIMPIHAEGNPAWRELEAVKELLMKINTHRNFFHEQPSLPLGIDTTNGLVHLRVEETVATEPGHHHHEVYVSVEDLASLSDHVTTIMVHTSTSMGHQHLLEIKLGETTDKYKIRRCDGEKFCWDLHDRTLELV